MSQRVMIFIDGSNFYHSLKSSFIKSKIDVDLFCGFISDPNNLIRIFYYNSPLNQLDNPEEYKQQQKFFEYLKTIKRLELFFGRLEKRANNHKTEKGVDVKLAIDLLVNAYRDLYDVAILVSNDSDFVPAIKEVQSLGKKIYNVSFPKSKSYHLTQVCDKTIYVNSIEEFLLE